ncbi:MAG: Ig-like domain-containing protein [Polyangiaceae bacterium]
MRRRTLLLVTLSFATVSIASASHAAPCGRPDLIDTVPPDGAAAVPLNAKLFARYATIAEYLNEDIVFTPDGEAPITVKGVFDSTEGLLSIEPPVALSSGARYKISWPRLRGISTASLGRGAEVEFTAGAGTDDEPPSFVGIDSVDWDVTRDQDDCTDRLEQRYVFDLRLGPASDDGGRDSLLLVVFQTKGPGLTAPKPVSVSRLPASGTPLVFKQTVARGAGEVCFAALVRDLTGKTSASAARETCTETVEPPFFEGCSMRGHGSPSPWWLLGLATLAARCVRRRRWHD